MEEKDKKVGSFSSLLDDKGNPIKQENTFERSETPPVQTKPPRPHPALYWGVVILFVALCLGLLTYRMVQHYRAKSERHGLPASTHMIVVEPHR